MEIGAGSGMIPVWPVVLVGLLLFGVAYNLVVTWLIRRGYDEGYTWVLVIIGVLLTLGGVAVLSPEAALLALGAFAASGLPMAVGAWWRHVRARRAGQDAQRTGVRR